tara:strand:+ start:18358 stop:18558 length:201 start_codon:yes stop_codon:yes gene_type:complete
MTKLQNLWIETDSSKVDDYTPTAIRIDWDNDRHQRVEIKGRNPLQVINALKGAALKLESELYKNAI